MTLLAITSFHQAEDMGLRATLTLLTISGLLRVIAADWAGLFREIRKQWNNKRDGQ